MKRHLRVASARRIVAAADAEREIRRLRRLCGEAADALGVLSGWQLGDRERIEALVLELRAARKGK